MSKLKDNVRAVCWLNEKMHADIVKFLKRHNGFVRTDNTERRDMGLSLCDNIYTISMDGDDCPNTEKRVLAVALFGEDEVAVLPDLSDNETILGMTDQEVLDCDNWELIYGGYTLQNATLTSICECIEQYVTNTTPTTTDDGILITPDFLKKNFGGETCLGWYGIYMVRQDEFDENGFVTKFTAIRDAVTYPKKERFAIIQDDKENVVCEVKYVHELQQALKDLGIDVELSV